MSAIAPITSDVSFCEGFRMPAHDGGVTRSGGRRTKTSKGGNRGRVRRDRAARARLWGFESCGFGVGEWTKVSSAMVDDVGVHERSVAQSAGRIEWPRLVRKLRRKCSVWPSGIMTGRGPAATSGGASAR
jgi:hypothetical protein